MAIGGIYAAVWTTYACVVVAGGLVALVAWRLAGPWAAPVAAVGVLATPLALRFGHMIMTEVPSATLALAELSLFVLLPDAALACLGAGILGAALVWLRPAAAPLLLAGVAATTARANRWRSAVVYVLGALPLLLLLGFVQFRLYGSPLTTGYQAAGMSPTGDHELEAFFSPQWLIGPPAVWDSAGMGGHATDWHLPNIVAYPLQLVGMDQFVTWPAIGVIGPVAAVYLALRAGPRAALGRFTLAAIVATLAVYAPYYYQSGRFLIIPGSLLALSTTTAIVPSALARIESWYWFRRLSRTLQRGVISPSTWPRSGPMSPR